MELSDKLIQGMDGAGKDGTIALTRCSTPNAPWFIVPADKKWFRNFAVSGILVETLEALDMRFPKPAFDPSRIELD
jgi:polyphosphate kinase 2 (PPK2 family)